MTSRRLPPAEWDRLAGTELDGVVPALRARGCEAVVLVVEDLAGAIVGCWSLFPVWHAEGFWIAPTHRGRAGVARGLLRAAAAVAATRGVPAVMTAAGTPALAQMLERLHAQPLPGAHYLLPLRRREKED